MEVKIVSLFVYRIFLGARRCLGDRFSLMEQKTLLMQILSRFVILGARDDMRGDMDEQNIQRASGSMEIVFNPPKESLIRLKKIEDF
jgi:hypothetical protein